MGLIKRLAVKTEYIYQVRRNHRVEGWQVILNAETGRVVESFSTVMNADSPRAARPR